MQRRSAIRSGRPRLQKIPYMLVVGAKEEEEEKVSVRSRFAGDEGQRGTGGIYRSDQRRDQQQNRKKSGEINFGFVEGNFRQQERKSEDKEVF